MNRQAEPNHEPERAQSGRGRRDLAWIPALLALVLAGVGCSVGQVLVGLQGGGATPTWTARPTFTRATGANATVPGGGLVVRGDLPPGVTVLPPPPEVISGGTGGTASAGSIDLVLFATPSPRPGLASPTSPSSSSRTPVATGAATARLTPQPTPYAAVSVAEANARRGPGSVYDIVGSVAQGEQLMVMGRNAGGDWWRVCCVSNQPVWISGEVVQILNPTNLVPVVAAPPTPTTAPLATRTNTPTARPTPLPPFDVGVGPLFPIQRDNGILTIWVMVFEGPADNQIALPGYVLRVVREGAEVSDNQRSHGMPFDRTDRASEGYLPYNLKFEMRQAGEANWQIYLARADGSAVSPVTRFTTLGDSYRNQVVYIGYWLAR